jgi:hypothetical protein
MRRFKSWLFIWLMGEHFAELDRDMTSMGKRLETRIEALELLKVRESQPVAEKVKAARPIVAKSWAEFQRNMPQEDQ